MTDTNDLLILDVDLNESDLQRANFWFSMRRWSNWLMLAIMPIAGVLLTLKTDFSAIAQQPIPAILALASFMFPAFYFGYVWFHTKRGFGKLKLYQTKVHYEFSSNGYKVSDEKSSGYIAWDAVPRAAESKHSFHIFLGTSIFHTIPKRCFKQRDDIGRLRDLLKRALGTKATLA